MRPTLLLLACALVASPSAHAQWSSTVLSEARANVVSVTIGELVFFAGGNAGSTFSDQVDIYDAATGAWLTPLQLSVARTNLAAASLGHLAFFAGGVSSPGGYYDVVDILDTQAMTWSTATLSQARATLAATSVGNKVLFAGGARGATNFDVVDVYDASVGLPSASAAWSTMHLATARGLCAAVTVGDVAIFAGGAVNPGGVPVEAVDLYDDSTGVWSTATLSEARILGLSGGVAVGTKAYFGGGHVSAFGGPDMSAAVDVYDAGTQQWSTSALSVARGYVGVAAIGNVVLFAGGSEVGHVSSAVVDSLNVGTGRWGPPAQLSVARRGPCAASVGGRALFAGGSVGGPAGGSATVDVYTPVGIHQCLATANSTGLGATMSSSGSADVAANDLVLGAVGLPAHAFGFFLTSRVAGFVPNAGGGQGTLCLGGSIGRYVGPGQIQNSGAGGAIGLTLDLASTPTPNGLVAVQPGETWMFQAWFRDANPTTTSNLTDALAVSFE